MINEGRGLKIALVYPGEYYSENNWTLTNGVATYVRGLSAALISRGHRVTILSVAREGRAGSERYEWEGATVIATASAGNWDFAEMVHRYLASDVHDVVEAHQVLHPLLVEQSLGRTPTVTRYASDVIDEMTETYRFDWYAPRVYGEANREYARDRFLGGIIQAKLSNKIICAGGVQRDRLANIGLDSELLPLGLSDEWFKPVIQPRRENIVVMVGRLDDPRKGGPLIEALANGLKAPQSGGKIQIVGSTSEEGLQALKSRIRRKKVDILSNVADDRLKQLYENAAAVVVPTVSESFGYVFLEPMARGCPVVCFQQVDPTKGSWPLITCGTPDGPQVIDAFNDGIKRAITCVDETTDAITLVDFAQRYAWSNLIERYEEMYNRAMLAAERMEMGVLDLVRYTTCQKLC